MENSDIASVKFSKKQKRRFRQRSHNKAKKLLESATPSGIRKAFRIFSRYPASDPVKLLDSAVNGSVEKITVYLSQHARDAIQPSAILAFSGALEPIASMKPELIQELDAFANPAFHGINLMQELHLATDGIASKSGIRFGSALFVMERAVGGEEFKICGFRSARLCQDKDQFAGCCWWLENGVTFPTGHGLGNQFLQLIHRALTMLRASKMYVKLGKTNVANVEVLS